MGILETARRYAAPAAKFEMLDTLPIIRDMSPWELFVGGYPSNIDGMFFPDKEAVYLSTAMNDEVLREGVLMHELTHWCQYLRDGRNMPIALDQAFLEREFEAFTAQRAYLRDHNYVERRGDKFFDLAHADDETLRGFIDRVYTKLMMGF